MHGPEHFLVPHLEDVVGKVPTAGKWRPAGYVVESEATIEGVGIGEKVLVSVARSLRRNSAGRNERLMHCLAKFYNTCGYAALVIGAPSSSTVVSQRRSVAPGAALYLMSSPR